MEDDFDKAEWQARQAQLDAAKEKQREKDRKSRARSARRAQRKLERLKAQLGEGEDLSDWEKEFSASVSERLDKYGSAFHDLQKGRSGEALSFSQKRVLSEMQKKLKAQKKIQKKEALKGEGAPERDYPRRSTFKKSGFKSKNRAGYKPRVRHIEDDMETSAQKDAPATKEGLDIPTKVKKPFLRLVKNETDTNP